MTERDNGRFSHDDVDKIVAECVDEFHDVKEAIKNAIKRIRKMPNFDVYVDWLIEHAIKNAVWQRRKHVNQAGKRAHRDRMNGLHPVTIRPVAGREDVEALADSNTRYVHFCAGRTIRDMYGRDLLDYARGELEKGKGNILNAMLAIELKKWTPDNVKVSDVVDLKLYDKLFKAAQARTDKFMQQQDKAKLPKELQPGYEQKPATSEAAC